MYERDVLPRIQAMTVPQLVKLTGLSQFHCWKVRKGERRLHARHWDAIANAGLQATVARPRRTTPPTSQDPKGPQALRP